MTQAPDAQTLAASRTAAAVTRNRRMAFGAGVFFLVGTVLMGAMALLGGFDVKIALLAVFSAAITVWAFRGWARQRNVLETPLFRVLRESPADVASVRINVQQAGAAEPQKTVHVKLSSGRQFVLYAIDAEKVLAELTTWCPQAQVG